MKRNELLFELINLQDLSKIDDGQEEVHIKADNLLLDFIDDIEINDAFNAIPKWYS